MKHTPTNIKSIRIGRNFSRRILMQAQINRNLDSHSNQIPTTEAYWVNQRILSKQ